ncbi:uncharacterized protein LTR77_005208 [Saxophila tyrrhenica]|uniref:Uncharacterized protein n=1 Tax=Saxophila tyrrhenica TaxID=1690608 RepID=A0AAV9PBK0_9PEZI|nr:hypothetical protein LTR77_005208 [Saxophila tyrrhenica]
MSTSSRTSETVKATDGAERGSEYLQGDFWAAFRLEEPDNADDNDGARQRDPETTLQETFVPEMQQISATSPLVFPILGLESHSTTPRTAFHQSSELETDDYFQMALREMERLTASDAEQSVMGIQNTASALPRKHTRSHQDTYRPPSRYSQMGLFRPAPSVLGPKPRPVLPSLSSAPAVPSWRRRAATALQPSHRGTLTVTNNLGQQGTDIQQPLTSGLLDDLVDSAWSEPSTPITPIDTDIADEANIVDFESSFTPDRSRRGNFSGHRDSRRLEASHDDAAKCIPVTTVQPKANELRSCLKKPKPGGAASARDQLYDSWI